MYRIIRFFNQNRKKIYKVILIIVFIIGIIQLLNALAKIENNSKSSNSTTSDTNILDNSFNKEVLSDKSAVTGKHVQTSKLTSETDVINEFMQYCNEGDLESAYGLITDECKEEMFNTIDDFKEIYYLSTFNGESKLYTIENWINNIYKVKISEDILATGKYTSQSSVVEYITVDIDDNDKYKLNINSYLGRKYLNKEAEYEDINIKVLEINEYMDYTTYVFEITNNSANTILLDDLNNIDTMYLEDNNEMKFLSYTHELTQEELRIKTLEKKQVKIKYYSKYGSTKQIKKIVFARLMLNIDNQDENQFGDYYTFEIGL